MKKSLGLCCVFLLASCGSDPGPVAGGGSDQPNKIQAVRFLTQDGQPAAGARVVTWSGTWDPVHSKQTTHRLDSGLTDQNGQWKVIVPESDWYVSAELEDQIAICPSSQREAVFGRVSSIRGRVVALNGIVVDSIWMGGAGDAFRLQSTGAFQLSTQVGPRRIWGRVHWNGGMDTLLLAEKFLDTSAKFFLNLVADTGSVLLVSAESYPNIASLRGQLFHSSDANSPKAFDDVPSKPIAVEEGKTLLADSIRYFRWEMADSATSLVNGKSHHIGFTLADRSLNWTGVEALRIHFTSGVRGMFRVKIATDLTDGFGDKRPLEFTIAPKETLSRDTIMVLRLSDFKPAAGSDADKAGLAWTDVRKGVSRISIEAIDGNPTLELREIRAIGNRWQNW
ncbi:MAG: hypothetical protein IPN71_19860 [Fibrobacteres bacterium]|jgi:hypothetical protein|nr:hypothetical protein [Fibrobacterota bacterium]